MARLAEITAYLDGLLEPAAFEDLGPNGVQVPGSEEVGMVATGVSAQLELFERAAAAGAQLLLCHHGLFWDFHPRSLRPEMKRRLAVLFESDMSLLAYHLPLDAHPEVGNNALICEALGLERGEPFGSYRGRTLGFVGRSSEGIRFEALRERCRATFGQDAFAWDSGPDIVHTLGVVSGAAASAFAEAIARGLDGFLTGEPAEHTMADAREAGVHFLSCGHYATETLGVRRLGRLLAERFGVEHHFIDLPNPI
ncbi:MAG: Nif3-like dinuclear metal center hexameric protein [Chloroflexota bacterium]|nr:Nif3-like dinuclear metal center hexameric protein [Chloroflexota bacterium]